MATDQHDTVTATLPQPGAGPQMRMVEIALIEESLTNPRKHFDQEALRELADSIRTTGVHQPVLLRPLPGHRVPETFGFRRQGAPLPVYELVAGARRLRACRLAKVTEIPAMIRELTDEQALEIQVIENLQRVDVSPLEESDGYRVLMERSGMTAKGVAEKIGKSVRYVYQRLQLLHLIPEAVEALRTGLIDPSKAREIACVHDPKLQKKALDYATEKDWQGQPTHTVRDIASWVRTNVMLRMDRARFDVASDKLCPEAGACSACPKRTGANPDLFSEDGPDLCTDPPCYRRKEEAHDQAAVEKAKKAGHKVITAEEARGLVNSQYISNARFKGYTLLDDTDYSIGVHAGTVRKALGKECPEPVIIIHPVSGKSLAAVKTSTARRILEKRQEEKAGNQRAKIAQAQAQLPVEERREYALRWQEDLVRTIADKITAAKPAAVTPELLRALLGDFVDWYDEGPIGKALGLPDEFHTSDVEDKLLTLSDEETPAVFMRWALLDACMRGLPPKALDQTMPRHRAAILADAVGVNVADVQATTKRTMEGEDRAKAMEAEAAKAPKPSAPLPPAAPAVVSRAKAKGIKGPAARAGATAPKTTAAEASAQIAAGLAALEGQSHAPAAQGDEAPAVPDGQPAASAAPSAADKAKPRLKNRAPAAQGDEAPPVPDGQAAASAAPKAVTSQLHPASAWPFPTTPAPAAAAASRAAPGGQVSADVSDGAAAKPGALAVGVRVRVNDHATGKAQKPWVDYEGIVASQIGDRAWEVDIKRSKRSAPKRVYFHDSELEVIHG